MKSATLRQVLTRPTWVVDRRVRCEPAQWSGKKFGSSLPSGQWQFRSVRSGKYSYFLIRDYSASLAALDTHGNETLINIHYIKEKFMQDENYTRLKGMETQKKEILRTLLEYIRLATKTFLFHAYKNGTT